MTQEEDDYWRRVIELAQDMYNTLSKVRHDLDHVLINSHRLATMRDGVKHIYHALDGLVQRYARQIEELDEEARQNATAATNSNLDGRLPETEQEEGNS